MVTITIALGIATGITTAIPALSAIPWPIRYAIALALGMAYGFFIQLIYSKWFWAGVPHPDGRSEDIISPRYIKLVARRHFFQYCMTLTISIIVATVVAKIAR
jgi:hypothetical protein